MSEILLELPIEEVLRPDVTPEMGFQSYEMLGSPSENRKQQETAFLAGDVRNPQLDYPLIDEKKLHDGIRKLEGILQRTHTIRDPEFSGAVWDSASYRMAEMYWLLEAKRMNDLSNAPDSEAFRNSAARYQELNEQLYGTPDPKIVANTFGEVLAQANEKELHPSAQRIKSDLENGFIETIAGEDITIRGIADVASGRLPELGAQQLATLKEVLQEDFADARQLVEEYWEGIVEPRGSNSDGELGFDIYDMQELFIKLRDLRDPDNTAKILIVIDPTSSQLSWDTPTMSVKIGAKRKPITDKNDMLGKLIHEYGVHGGRAVKGLSTKLPVLGTGLFTDADEGERSDYLTFEEGWGSMCEIAINDAPEQWKPMHVSRYIASAQAYNNADFRESFEINWRARVLMAVKPGQEVTDAMVLKEKKQAYLSTVRLLRGTPTQLSTGTALTFNKDLSYLHGKLDVLRFLAEVGNDKVEIRKQFYSKHDPLNKRQKALADKYMLIAQVAQTLLMVNNNE